MFLRALVPIVLLLAACGQAEGPMAPSGPELPDACNGSVTLCARSYDAASYVTTHNAMSNLDGGWLFANQRHSITRQLEDGVRALMLDTHVFEEEAYLCHGSCDIGRLRLSDGLAEIDRFLDANRGAVVTLIFETYAPAELTLRAFQESGISDRLYAHTAGDAWPTLRDMVDRDERVVVFTDADGGTYPWYHGVWDFAFETHWSVKTKADMNCAKNRGNADNDLFILNHFMTNPVASERWANEVNFDPFLGERARQCADARGHIPNFVAVDFYSIGDVVSVVAGLNVD